MTKKDSTSKQIYYRPANKWIEVTENDKRNWERFVGTIRKSRQRAGICCVPFKKSYKCDGICENCEFCCTPEDTVQPLSIDFETEIAQENGISCNSFLGDESLITKISVDSIILKSLLNELKESDPESYEILLLIAEGVSERDSAKRLGMPRNTFVYKRDKLLKALRKKF